MILKNVHTLDRNNTMVKRSIAVSKGKIDQIFTEDIEALYELIEFPNAVIAFPGLINSHDHLALNTHTIHKNRIYSDYIDWAADNFEDTIKEINDIPFKLRYEWGILKNVLQGFTTVLQHDLAIKNYKTHIADVFTDTMTIHSLAFDKKWKLKAMFPTFRKKIIHLAEGTSDHARHEPKRFLKRSIHPKNTLVVHGIGLTVSDGKKFGGLIWCPNSNTHLYGLTANVGLLKNTIPILFGTDSTISADWNFWKHLKQARHLDYLSDNELFDSMTKTPSKVFNWKHKGSLSEGKIADIIIARKREEDFYNSFYALEPEDILLIVKSGKIIFYDASLAENVFQFIDNETFEKIDINNHVKYLGFRVKKLTSEIKKHYPSFSFDSYFKLL